MEESSIIRKKSVNSKPSKNLRRLGTDIVFCFSLHLKPYAPKSTMCALCFPCAQPCSRVSRLPCSRGTRLSCSKYAQFPVLQETPCAFHCAPCVTTVGRIAHVDLHGACADGARALALVANQLEKEGVIIKGDKGTMPISQHVKAMTNEKLFQEFQGIQNKKQAQEYDKLLEETNGFNHKK